MKRGRIPNEGHNQMKPASHQHIPQNKDNLDSRANEEQDTKGDDITHNKRETKKHHLRKRS